MHFMCTYILGICSFYIFTNIVERKSYKTTCVAVVSLLLPHSFLLISSFSCSTHKLFMTLFSVFVYISLMILKERFSCFDKRNSFKKFPQCWVCVLCRKVILFPFKYLAALIECNKFIYFSRLPKKKRRINK